MGCRPVDACCHVKVGLARRLHTREDPHDFPDLRREPACAFLLFRGFRRCAAVLRGADVCIPTSTADGGKCGHTGVSRALTYQMWGPTARTLD